MKSFLIKLFYALLLFLLHTGASWAMKCIEKERKALLMFKQGIQDDYGILSTWNDVNGDCCKWNGVRCSNQTGHVQVLDLRASLYVYYNLYFRYHDLRNITLLIELEDLRYLDLSYNRLSSQILNLMGSFSHLTYLNLSHVGFVGKIPYQLGMLPRLQYLDLSYNSLDGTIPYQLGNLSKLKNLNLGENYLVGAIPYQLGNLSMLESLNLGYNQNLKINEKNHADVKWLSSLSSLITLDLSNLTSYSHQWLRMIGKLHLRELKLRESRLNDDDILSLSGSSSNFSTSLIILDLSDNNFSSAIFQWAFNFNSNLQYLYLINCRLSSTNLIFPSSYFNFYSLVMLDLSSNHLASSTIFHWVFNFTSNLHELYLSNNLLEGPIPYAFGNAMNSLQYLDLSFNKLQGVIPSSLGNICTLKTLFLSSNNLSGELSSFIHNSSRCNRHPLQRLDLSFNHITGILPDLSIFSSLYILDFFSNQLIGEIPKSIGLLLELQYLELDGNFLKGVITESHFANLSNLKTLSLSDNSLSLKVNTSWVPPFHVQYLNLRSCMLGPNFPNWLQTQNDLVALDISNAGISDSVPRGFWRIFENIISIMNISYNNFSGEIPNLPLKSNGNPEMILNSNNFEGPIPSFLAQSSALHLSKNKFSDLVPLLCSKNEDERVLEILDASDNYLRGRLPDCWSNKILLQYLDLSNNNLSGEIPPSIGSLVNVEALILRNNSLIGELPSFLMNCTKLLLLDVSKNKLLGPIPSWIGTSLGQLQILSLRVNHFNGSVPSHLCHLTHIQILDLSQNNLSKVIPPCLKNFTTLAQKSINSTQLYHSYKQNMTRDALVFRVTSFDFYITLMWKGVDDKFKRPESLLKSIDLSSNDLTGEIPTELESLFGLVSLNLSRNNLSGQIPSEIGNLESLEFLDFSRNNLFGTIPSSLAHIDRLTALDLSSNNLFGKIPIGTQLQSFNVSSYEGNMNLCGMPLDKKCPEDETPSPQVSLEDDNSLFSREFYTSLGLGFAVGFWGFVGPIIFNRSWRHAYYRLVNKVTDSIYVMVAVYVAR